MEEGSNLKRAALYGVAGLMTAAIGASTVNVLASEDKKPEPRPVSQSATPKPAETTPPPPPAPKPVPVPQAETAPAPAPSAPEPQAAPAPPPAPVAAKPAAPRVVKPVAQMSVVKRQVVVADEAADEPAPLATAQVQASGLGKAEVALNVPAVAKPVKKPSPTDEALKKAKSEATEAKKKVKHAEKQLVEAKKDYEKKKGEIKKVQKQKNEEKKTKKPKPVEPVLTVKTSPDMEKRLKVHTSKQKSGKKVTISVSSHSG